MDHRGSAARSADRSAAGGKRVLQTLYTVVLKLRGRQAGFEASLGVGGATITMQ